MRALFFAAALITVSSNAYAKEEPTAEALQTVTDMTRLGSIQSKCNPGGVEGDSMGIITGLFLFAGAQDWTTKGYEKARLNKEIAELEVKTKYSCNNWKKDVADLEKKLGMGDDKLTDEQRLERLKARRNKLD